MSSLFAAAEEHRARMDKANRVPDLIAMVLFVPTVALVLYVRGFVLAKLWLWFVVPQFNAAPLAITTALGLSAIVLLHQEHPDGPEAKSRPMWERQLRGTVFALLKSGFFLLLGWLLTVLA